MLIRSRQQRYHMCAKLDTEQAQILDLYYKLIVSYIGGLP